MSEKRELTKDELFERKLRRVHRENFRSEVKTQAETQRARRAAIKAVKGPWPGRFEYRHDQATGQACLDYERPEHVHRLHAKLRLIGERELRGREARHWLLAYAFWRGMPYRKLEPTTRPGYLHQPDPKEIARVVRGATNYRMFNLPKSTAEENLAKGAEAIKAWMAVPAEARPPQPKREKRPYAGPKGARDERRKAERVGEACVLQAGAA